MNSFLQNVFIGLLGDVRESFSGLQDPARSQGDVCQVGVVDFFVANKFGAEQGN